MWDSCHFRYLFTSYPFINSLSINMIPVMDLSIDSILSLQTLQLAAVDGGVLELHCGLQRLRVGRQAGGRRRRDLPLPAKPPGQ